MSHNFLKKGDLTVDMKIACNFPFFGGNFPYKIMFLLLTRYIPAIYMRAQNHVFLTLSAVSQNLFGLFCSRKWPILHPFYKHDQRALPDASVSKDFRTECSKFPI